MNNEKKIGIIDADLLDNGTRHPNLALMKISSYCKKEGFEPELLYNSDNYLDFDYLIISKVFTFTKLPEQLEELLDWNNLSLYNTSIKSDLSMIRDCSNDQPKIAIGGTGFFDDGGNNLDDEIEHAMPDYDLYSSYVEYMINVKHRKPSDFSDYTDYSIGFTSRGCFRKCSFCVNKKYNAAFRHSKVSEFYDDRRPGIYLWDDNVLALPESDWREIFQELQNTGKPFQFRQGLDLRLMTDEAAELITSYNFSGDYIFAFDHYPRDKDIIREKLELWRHHCFTTTKLYVLCAYVPLQKMESWDRTIHMDQNRDLVKKQFELEDVISTFERIKILMEFGCIPYIMRHEGYRNSYFKDLYIQIARWCNQPEFFKKKSFREYCIANKDYTKNETCKTYQAMVKFEEEYKEIADKYFDLRYDELNRFGCHNSYSKSTKPCPVCVCGGVTWDKVVSRSITGYDLLRQYYTRSIEIDCLIHHHNRLCATDVEKAVVMLVGAIQHADIDDILSIVDGSETIPIKTNMIPQPGGINNKDEILSKIMQVLSEEDCLSYEELGRKLLGDGKSRNAYTKYGETYSKFSTLLDLTVIDNHPVSISLSPIGKLIMTYSEQKKAEFYTKQILRIPIIQLIIKDARNNTSIRQHIKDLFSESTIERRTSSISFMLSILKQSGSKTISDRLRNIIDYEED